MKKVLTLLLMVGSITSLLAQNNIELMWNTSPYMPYVDFSNDNITDYDMRIILSGDDLLTFYGGDVMLGEGNIRMGLAERGLTFYGGGERIIGTTAFGIQLQTNNATPRMTILNSGEVGIGTDAPSSLLDMKGNLTLRNMNNVSHGGTSIHFTSYDIAHPGPIIRSDLHSAGGAASNSNLVLSSYWGGYKNEITLMNGNVGIGTASPTQRLTVKGTVYSTEVKVDVAAGTGPDYVFEPTYTLPSLDSVQSYINQNKHLPEVPSAKEMEANGVNLGEMNMLLLKKVEELMLYVIELKKENQLQNKSIQQLIKIK